MSAPSPAAPNIATLPAICRGIPELHVYLRLPVEFIDLWLSTSTPNIPAMPHHYAGATYLFQTAAVLRWLERYFGYGDEMRPQTQRPAAARTKSKRQPAL